MRSARLAATAALALSATGVLPLAGTAHAAVTDLYVGRDGCSDTDAAAGSRTVPFCTAAAAAKVVLPGQTVHLDGNYNGPALELTRSGTAQAPITFTGPEIPEGTYSPATRLAGLTVRGAHDIRIRRLLLSGKQETLLVADSQRVTLDGLDVSGFNSTTAPYPAAVRLTGRSSDITLSRSTVEADRSDGVEVDAGVTHAVMATPTHPACPTPTSSGTSEWTTPTSPTPARVPGSSTGARPRPSTR